jgi:hypothetical protein
MISENEYSDEKSSEEDKDFFDKYSPTGESEWSRGSTVPFDDEKVLIERHYNLGSLEQRRSSQFSRVIPRDNAEISRHPHRKDAWIKEDVRNALYNQAEIDATEIDVQVTEGVVTLSGKVENRLAKKIAEQTTEKCLGVTEVKNQLRIGLLSRGLFTH